jgi:hypothetical protein
MVGRTGIEPVTFGFPVHPMEVPATDASRRKPLEPLELRAGSPPDAAPPNRSAVDSVPPDRIAMAAELAARAAALAADDPAREALAAAAAALLSSGPGLLAAPRATRAAR